MSEHGEFGDLATSGGMTENLATLVHPATGSASLLEVASILRDFTPYSQAQYFQLDLDQAPQAIATFRQVAEEMRDLKDKAARLANITPPGLDAVSINAAKEIGRWAASDEPGSLRSALESGALQLEKAADALEQSLSTHRNTDEFTTAHLSRLKL
ncbi:MAG: hypothetical protein ACRDRU_08465 [Pseudonocardiaceae bacterium]